MRTLKYAILGLLNQSSMTGYDLMKEFESALTEFWYAKHSQIYPELKKLTDEGCVSYEIQITGVSLEKKLYAITDKGREDFMNWLSENSKLPVTPKDVSKLKVFYSGALSEELRQEMFRDQLEQHKARLQHLEENMKKFRKIPARDSHEFGDYLLLHGAIMREKTTCEWLAECIELSRKNPQSTIM